MALVNLSLINFRNIKSEKLSFDQRINTIIGDNAQGKTNLLEAIYFCCTMRSFRSSRLEEIVNRSEKRAELACEFEVKGISHRLDLEIEQHKSKARMDNKRLKKASEMSGKMIPFLFSSESNFLFDNFPSARRKLLDRYISLDSKDYIQQLKEAKGIYSQKMSLLKKGGKAEDLQAWNRLQAKNSLQINNARITFVAKINELLPQIASQMTSGSESINLKYRPNLKGETEQQIADYLDSKQEQEKTRKQVLFGNHLDRYDLQTDTQQSFSSGQSKAIYHSLLMSFADVFKQTRKSLLIFLVDDIMAGLDEQTSKALIDRLTQTPNQLFITANRQIKQLSAKIFKAKEGTFREQN